jgi:hypothetical protein
MKLRSLFKPTAAQRKRWLQEVNARGKKSFVMWVGVVRWGGLAFLITTAMALFSETSFRRTVVNCMFLVGLNLLIWPLGGYFWGLYMWNIHEKQFSESGKEQSAKQM